MDNKTQNLQELLNAIEKRQSKIKKFSWLSLLAPLAVGVVLIGYEAYDVRRQLVIVNELKTQSDKLKTQRDELVAQTSNLKFQNGDLQTQMNGLKVESNTLQERNGNLVKQNQVLDNKYKDLVGKTADLESKAEDLEVKKAELLKQYKELAAKKASLEGEIAGLETKLKNASRQNAQDRIQALSIFYGAQKRFQLSQGAEDYFQDAIKQYSELSGPPDWSAPSNKWSFTGKQGDVITIKVNPYKTPNAVVVAVDGVALQPPYTFTLDNQPGRKKFVAFEFSFPGSPSDASYDVDILSNGIMIKGFSMHATSPVKSLEFTFETQ